MVTWKRCGTVLPVISQAAEAFREQHPGVRLMVNAGGSGVAVNQVGEGRIGIGMISRDLTQEEKTRFPETDFVKHVIGRDAVVPVDPRQIFEEGIEALEIAEIRTGRTILTGGVLLAIVILPIVITLSEDALHNIPAAYREAAFSLGLYRHEVVGSALLPIAKTDIIGGVLLGLGRAMGETMAVMLVLGSIDRIPEPIFNTRIFKVTRPLILYTLLMFKW